MRRFSSLIPPPSSLLVFFAILIVAASAFALDVPPAPAQWFTDRAGLVSGPEADALNAKLAQFEQTSGAQFIIYILPSLEGDSLEDFTIRAVEKWKVGQKKYDNGLVLFVFSQDRKIRIEVGYGLEGTMTDAFSSRVIRDVMAPRFSQNDWAGGLNAAADAIIAKITKGEDPVAPMQRPRNAADQIGTAEINPLFVIIILFVVFFVIVPALTRGGRRGGGCGGCFWPMMFFPGGGGGGFTIGRGGGGWGGGGGGGFGGFSGGGGSFGGGGASGGW
jgi:uncharacterized protein